MRCDVTKQPPGRPLVFQTPHAELTVLGTALSCLRRRLNRGCESSEAACAGPPGGGASRWRKAKPAPPTSKGCKRGSRSATWTSARCKTVPPQLETVYCDTHTLHTARTEDRACAQRGSTLEDGGLQFVDSRPYSASTDCWSRAGRAGRRRRGDRSRRVGGGQVVAGHGGGGDSFEGYRIIFVAPNYLTASAWTASIRSRRRCWRRIHGRSRRTRTTPSSRKTRPATPRLGRSGTADRHQVGLSAGPESETDICAQHLRAFTTYSFLRVWNAAER